MDVKQLIELRKEAEKAVAEMPDGDLKLKAFEVILNHLIGGTTDKPAVGDKKATREKTGAATVDFPAESAYGRILLLKDEAFFKSQRSLGEIREELKAHGWHYPASTLGARLIELVQKKKLRRLRIKEGNKKVWKYSNP